MDIILKEDIATLGKAGDVVKVSDGYARNFLFPRMKAVAATPSALANIEKDKAARARRAQKEKKTFLVLKEKIDALVLTIPAKVGEQDKLFGSVTGDDVAAALSAQGVAVDKKQIVLDEPIKSLGDFTVAIKLFPEVEAAVKVLVVKES